MSEKIVNLGEGEEIVMTIRRHWYSLAIEGFVDIFIFVLSLIGVSVFDAILVNGGMSSGVTLPLSLFFLSLVCLLLWMHFFTSWSDHWLDVWFITNKRIIDIEQKGFFVREVSSFPLEKIQDVTYTVAGVIPTWLHFGDVRIQTASISEDFIMRQVPFPDIVKEQLIHFIDVNSSKN